MNESVKTWLSELAANPSPAIQKLVLGYAGVPAWSRSSLRESFVEIFQTHAETLDSAVAGWLSERLMGLPPENTPALVWASHLQDLFSALAGLPMPLVARLLRDRLRDFRSWLRPLRTDESLDPESAFLAALAWAETNQSLEGMWQGLALRRDGEPAYYTDIGLLGLCKTRDERTKMPPQKAPFLLLATLVDLADLPGISQKEWLLTTRSLLSGYHYSEETWVREFQPVLESKDDAKRGPEWLVKVLPRLRFQQDPKQPSRKDIRPAPSIKEVDSMVSEVRTRGPAASGEQLANFLTAERAYVNATRDPHYLVRTFNRLAEAARTHDPSWAVARAEEALAWDERNARNWTVLARCLWARGRRALTSGDRSHGRSDLWEAIDTLWDAQRQFPTDAYARTELAKLYRASGDTTTAVSIYKQAAADFPNDPWCLAGLADTLLQRSRDGDNSSLRDEARSLLKEAAALGNEYAIRRLNTLALPDEGSAECVDIESQSPDQMRPAQRLGRALLAQWQGTKKQGHKERERFFAQAEALLAVPDELTGDCRAAFIEARGFLLLARNRVPDARAYFEQHLVANTLHHPQGLRLGFAEARARLGEALTDIEEAELESFGPEGSILPLVLKAVRLLESTASDGTLREVLLELYPRVRELARMPARELGEDDEPDNPAVPARKPDYSSAMMARFLQRAVFDPANINTPEDLQVDGSMLRVRDSLKDCRADIWSMAERLELAA